MKPTTLIVVGAAALCGGLPAGAQTSGNIAAAPHSTTGPTVPDPRQIDQGIVLPPGSNPTKLQPQQPRQLARIGWLQYRSKQSQRRAGRKLGRRQSNAVRR